MRAHVLRAVERLDPGLAATTSSERIIVRCDLNGESHKEVAAGLGISRRQFYLDRRAERIIDRSELPYASARQQRIRARIALEKNGDAAPAVLELNDALRTVQQHKQLPAIAKGALEYGIALAGGVDRGEAMKYIDYASTGTCTTMPCSVPSMGSVSV